MSIITAPFRALGAVFAKIETACTSDAETTKAVHLADQYAKLQTSIARSLITVTEQEERVNKWLEEDTAGDRKITHKKHEDTLSNFLKTRGITLPTASEATASTEAPKPQTKSKAKTA